MDDLTIEVTPEEQQALDNLRGKTDSSSESKVPDGFNEDGTPKENLILGKFKSQEDLEKAYKELETKLGQPKQEETPKQEEIKTDDKQPINSFDVYEKEFFETGKLSEDSYKALEKMGFNKTMVDAYVAGQEALAKIKIQEVYSAVGGESSFKQLTEWAGNNYTESQIKEFNDAMNSGNDERMSKELELLVFRAGKNNPSKPKRIEGTSASSGGMQPFRDKGEFSEYTANKLYGKDY